MANSQPTLYDIVLDPLLKQQRKHDLGDGWALNQINILSNVELLELISVGLNDLLTTGEHHEQG